MGVFDPAPNPDAVPLSYLPGYIVLSYVISAMGCITTLELLHRRTAMAGLYNWYLLITSSLTMGGIGVWCMHFIGNRAIVLGDGSKHMQISYSVTFTAVSFVLPVCVLLIAFGVAGAGEKASYARILVGGFLTGGAICGMHYVGQLGIANYRCSYSIQHIAGSAIIAVYASAVALGIFFRWRATWTDRWWRRGISAAMLAGAAAGMHWTAVTGTSYMDHDKSVHGSALSRSKTVIICAVLSCVSCTILLICAFVAGGNRRRSSEQAHQLVLSCAFFDPSGRIMVTPDAFLPTRKIVEHYIGRTFNDDDLTRTHPAFLWAFRASRNWKLVKDLVPFMKHRVESERSAIERHVLSRGVVMDKETELQTDFDTLFKQLFCMAAHELSEDLRQPLQDLGMLYDHIVATKVDPSNLSKAVGNNSTKRGDGKVVFTVRHLSKAEAGRLGAQGYRFATIKHVTTVLSRRIHVPFEVLSHHLADMRDYATTNRNFVPGVHLTSWVMRPTIHDHFEVLTAKGTGNPLPSSTLPIKRLQMQHLDLISHMGGWPIIDCINWLRSDASRADGDEDDFRSHLIKAMSSLYTSLPQDVNAATTFCPRPLVAPCRNTGPGPSDEQRCFLLAFCAVGTLETQTSIPELTFAPLRLFRVQQQVNEGVFDRDISKELSQELFYSNVKADSNPPPQPKRPAFRLWPKNKYPTNSTGLSATSQESLVENPSPFGEIMVHKEVKVDVAKFSESSPSSGGTGARQSRTTVVTGDVTASTYVDELYSFCHSHSVKIRSDSVLPPTSSLAES